MKREVKRKSEYFRRSGVHVFVPPNFRKEFWELAQKQNSGSLSEWMRPKLLRWLAEEKPELTRDVESYLKAYSVMRQLRGRAGGSMKEFEYDNNDE